MKKSTPAAMKAAPKNVKSTNNDPPTIKMTVIIASEESLGGQCWKASRSPSSLRGVNSGGQIIPYAVDSTSQGRNSDDKPRTHARIDRGEILTRRYLRSRAGVPNLILKPGLNFHAISRTHLTASRI